MPDVEFQSWRIAHEAEHKTLDEALDTLRDDITEIKGGLAQMATRADVMDLRSHVDRSVRDTMRDALRAVPHSFALACALIMMGLTAIAVLGQLRR